MQTILICFAVVMTQFVTNRIGPRASEVASELSLKDMGNRNVKLPWIFPEAQLNFNGNSENIENILGHLEMCGVNRPVSNHIKT